MEECVNGGERERLRNRQAFATLGFGGTRKHSTFEERASQRASSRGSLRIGGSTGHDGLANAGAFVAVIAELVGRARSRCGLADILTAARSGMARAAVVERCQLAD